jgi:hypothetical protein
MTTLLASALMATASTTTMVEISASASTCRDPDRGRHPDHHTVVTVRQRRLRLFGYQHPEIQGTPDHHRPAHALQGRLRHIPIQRISS